MNDERVEIAAGLMPSCQGCPLSTNRTCGRFTAVEGRMGLGVLMVGEASGRQEGAAGLPFRPKAPAGSVLERVIRKMNWERERDFAVTNILRCHPPNDFLVGAPYEMEAIAHCRPNLDEVIAKLKPRAIIALGATALRELTGLSGEKLTVTYLRGYVLPGVHGIPVIPTFHPSYLGRGTMKYLGLLMRDVARAVTVAQRGIAPCTDLTQEVECRVGIEDLREIYERALADPALPIGIDCETEDSREGDDDEVVEFLRDLAAANDTEPGGDPDYLDEDRIEEVLDVRQDKRCSVAVESSQLRTVQFAIDGRWGVSVPWEEGYRELELAILALPNEKIWQNGDLFDGPVFDRHGAAVGGGKDDLLVMAKNLQPDLPAHLQAIVLNYRPNIGPWKHLAGVNLELYGAIDAAVLIDARVGLERDMKRIKGPNGVTVWDGYVLWTRPLRPVLDGVTRRGLPVDARRLDELRSWLEEQLRVIERELQVNIPDELRRGKLAEGCKAVPEDVKEWLHANMADLFAPTIKHYKNGATKEIKSKVKITEVYQWLMGDDPDWGETRERVCSDLGYVVRIYNGVSDSGSGIAERRLVRLKDWNPGSSLQMLDYLRFRKYKIPTDFKTGKPTTRDKDLEKLWRKTKDPVLKLSRDRRQTSQLRNNYTGKVGDDGIARGGWIPGPDGRLRSTIKLTSATWQLKAVNPNILTLPKRRKELADRFRKCVAAEPGHVMIEFDYSGFHSLMTAREARDKVLHRVSTMDPHAFVAGWMKKFPGIETALDLSDADLKEFLVAVKTKWPEVRENQAKPFVHGVNFGEGPRRIYHENSEHFKDEAEAKKIHGLMKRIFHRTFEWQEEIVERADREGRLVSNWGAVRWFWDAIAWSWRDGRWVKSNGSQAEQAMAFLPANHSHGMMRMKLIRMREWGWDDRYGLINIPHDAIWLHCRKELAEECISYVGAWLRAPVVELADEVMCPGGFVCGVDIKIGPNLGEMEKVKL